MKVIVDHTELRVSFKHEDFGKDAWIHHQTTCRILELEEGKAEPILIATGVAECCALDNFSKETGRKIALTRAIEQMALPKEERTAIWNQYHNRDRAIGSVGREHVEKGS